MKTLRAAKRAATLKEYRRVFQDMNLPARDIWLEFKGKRYVRRVWQNINRFGWHRWEEE